MGFACHGTISLQAPAPVIAARHPSILTRFSSDAVACTRGSLHREEAAVGSHSRLTCVAVGSLGLSHLHNHARLGLTCDWLFPGTDDPVYNSDRSRPCRAARSQSQSSDSRPAIECTPWNRAVADVVQPSVLRNFFFAVFFFNGSLAVNNLTEHIDLRPSVFELY